MTNRPSTDSDARRVILDRLRSKPVTASRLPDVDRARVIVFDDPWSKFSEMLEMVGGEVHFVDGPSDVQRVLGEIDVYRDAERVVSLTPEVVEGTFDAAAVEDPHDLATVDWTIAKGEFMIAENGAIWIDGKTLPHRVLLFIAQYLAIVVPKSQIVSNMHEAYQRIEGFDSRFGIFVSGPSKTADIEQSLVLGAHGCRKLQVFVMNDD